MEVARRGVTRGCPRWRLEGWPDARPGHGPRRGRGEAAGATHPRSRQAGRPLRWELPPDRLRAVEPGQRWLLQDRRPDPVQEPQPRPSPGPDLADEHDAQ